MRRTIKPKLSDLDSVEIEATPTPAPAPAKKPTRAATPKKAVAEVAVPEKPKAAPKKVVAKAPAKKSTPKPTVKSDLQDEVDAIAQEYVPTFRAPAKKTAASSTVKDVNKEEAQPEVKGRRARVEKPKPSPVVNEEPYVEWIKPEFVKLTAKQAIAAVEGDLPVPIWRPKSDSPPQQHEDSEESTGNLAPRRNRNKRRGEENPVTAADALQTKQEDGEGRGRRERPARKPREVAVKEPVVVAPPAPTVRALIPIPEDAPQIIKKDGHLILVRNKTAIPPIFFFGTSPDENRLNTVLEEIKHAAENGVRVFTHLVELDVEKERVKDAVSYAAFMLKKTLEIAPDAQLLFRVVFTAQPGWERRFAKARFAPQGGGLAEPSFADDEFWSEAEGCLREFCGMLRQLDQKDSVLGVQLERGEWFFADGWGYDTSPAAVEKFREWLRVRYRGEIVAMRASWFDGQVQFDTAVVPPYLPKIKRGEEFVRTDRKARRWVDYHLFLSDMIMERIGKLAYAVKEVSEGYLLVGVSYGYTFEWSHPANGHLALGKLLRTPEVDFIAGPPSYKNREAGGSAAFPCPIDSIVLNGKLYISEEDFKTPFSGRQEPDDFNPVINTPQALESVHWRGAGAAFAHQSGIAWMDLWGNGWLNTPGIWQRGAAIREALARRVAAPANTPDVAVFVDERSLSYLVDQRAFQLLVQDVRESVMRSGMSVGFYLLSDFAHREQFPESRLYVFMNAWDVRPEVRSAIKERLQRDGKVLFWLYAAGLFDGGRESLERVREITGIALKPQPFGSKPGTTLLQNRHPLVEALPEKSLAQGGTLEPSYFAIPEDGIVLGEYTETGLPSFVVRNCDSDRPVAERWTSVFLGEPTVTPALFRALGQMAGAHVWSYQDDVVHVREPFLTVHCKQGGTRTIALPEKWSAYNLQTQEWATVDATHLRFNAIDGMTYTFLVGPRNDIETLLQTPMDDLLRVDEIPARTENTIRLDQLNFDVSVVQLDEFMEDSWSDDFADDLLLRPSAMDLDAPALDDDFGRDMSPRTTSRERGRGRGRTASIDEFSAKGEVAEDGSMSMNVVFRKRE